MNVSSDFKTNIKNNRQENLDMTALQQLNQLMIKSSIIQPGPFPEPSTILRGNQICMSDLYMDHRKFAITPKDRYKYQVVLI